MKAVSLHHTHPFFTKGIRSLAAVFFAIFFSVALTSCHCGKTITVEKPVYIHDSTNNVIVEKQIDTAYIDRWHTEIIKGDSVIIKDSIFQKEVQIKEVHDTSFAYKEVPVTVTEKVEVPVEKPLKWYQKTLQFLGWIVVIAILGFVFAFVINKVWKLK